MSNEKWQQQLQGLTMPPLVVATMVASLVLPHDVVPLMVAPLLAPSPLPTPLVLSPLTLVLCDVALMICPSGGTTGSFLGLPLALFGVEVELSKLPLSGHVLMLCSNLLHILHCISPP